MREYSQNELLAALRRTGISYGDTVFVHACLDTLGQLDGAGGEQDTAEALFAALRELIGADGTLLVPSYTFSFCRHEPFDVQHTPTQGGPWSTSATFLEYIRRMPGSIRSRDPIHSVVGIGPRAAALLENVPNTCFGAGSVFERLHQAGAKICMVGVELGEATFRHYVEEAVGVPFRFKKLFTGVIHEPDKSYKTGWLYHVRIMAPNAFPDGRRIEQYAREQELCRVAALGRGEILTIPCQDLYEITVSTIANDPWATARGPAGDPVELEEARVGGPHYEVALPKDATMPEMIAALWQLPRDIVSAGYDAALHALSTQLPMAIHEYPSGSECWSWIVPERWTCHEAYVATLDGRKLFSYAENPLHVVSYSLPFEGEVTRDELLQHLHVHPHIADAVPFQFKYYERDWGLCCSRLQRDALTDERYRVVIRTDFSYSTLKVGEVVVPGRSDETIVLCAHLCHPMQVNDDLSGVVVGMEVMRALLARRDLRYTYRLLIVPETIGSVAYLSHNEALIPQMRGGLFLEMLGLDNPHALQLSFDGTTDIDQCFTMALRENDPQGWTGPFRSIIGNDERQFNAPGVRVPMLSLSRVLPSRAAEYPYREYHSNHDSPERASSHSLAESRDLVLRMIDTLEQNVAPVNLYKGEPFCSRYGLHIDAYTNPEGHRALFDILFLIDGTRNVADIAQACGISFAAARTVVEELKRHGLVGYH